MRSNSSKPAELDFKKILDAAPDSLLIVDAQGNIQYTNARVVRMFGYSARELRGKPIELLIPSRFGTHRELREAYQKKPLERSMGFGLKIAALHKDGFEFPVEVHLNPIKIGRDTYIVAAVQDISAVQQAEVELQKSLIRYHYLLDNMLEGCQIIDFDWRYIYLNEIAAQQGRRPIEDLLMHTMMEIYPGVEDTALFAALQTCMQQRISIKLENQFAYPDGSTAWFDLRVEPIPEGIFILSIDITDRKQAEELLKRNENRYRTLFVDSPVSLMEVDLSEVKRRIDLLRQQGVTDFKAYSFAHPELAVEWAKLIRIVDANRSVVELYQAGDKEDLLDSQKTILEKYLTQYFQDELIAIIEGKTQYSHEATGMTLTGGRIDVQVTWSVAPDFEDDLSKVIVAITDISERKQAEEVVKARTEALTMLYDLSRDLANADSLEAVLNIVNRHTVETIHGAFSRIALLEGDKFVIRSAYPTYIQDHDLQIGDHIRLDALPVCRSVLQQNEPVVLLANDPQLNAEERAILLFDFARSACLIPLQIGDAFQDKNNILGMLMIGEVQDVDGEPFDWYKIRLAQNIGDQAAITIRRMLLHEQNIRQIQILKALSQIDRVIASIVDVNASMHFILPLVTEQLKVDAASVLLFKQELGSLTYLYGQGFREGLFEQDMDGPLGKSLPGRVIANRRMLHVPDLAMVEERDPRFTAANSGEGFVCYFGVPLTAKGRILGVLQIFNRSPLTPDEDWLELLQTLAGQVAIAIDTASLFNDLDRSNLELTLAYETTLEGWSAALDLRDKETEGHTQRVTSMTMELARAIGMTEQELVNVRRGALLHDIGKMGVPDHILLKEGPLTDEEWVLMRKHPVFAFELLSHITYLHDALDIPYCHHEKWDGTGYPRCLKGREIPLAARIFAVVDIYDAVTSDRPYRKAWSRQQALDYIREQSGSHLDPEVVQAFLKMMENR